MSSNPYNRVANSLDRSGDIPAQGAKIFLTSADATAGVIQLQVGQCDVICEIPLADANSYQVKLPPVADTGGQVYRFLGRRATGSYVDGEVTVIAYGDGFTFSETDGMTATADRLQIENFMGEGYIVTHDTTT